MDVLTSDLIVNFYSRDKVYINYCYYIRIWIGQKCIMWAQVYIINIGLKKKMYAFSAKDFKGCTKQITNILHSSKFFILKVQVLVQIFPLIIREYCNNLKRRWFNNKLCPKWNPQREIKHIYASDKSIQRPPINSLCSLELRWHSICLFWLFLLPVFFEGSFWVWALSDQLMRLRRSGSLFLFSLESVFCDFSPL